MASGAGAAMMASFLRSQNHTPAPIGRNLATPPQTGLGQLHADPSPHAADGHKFMEFQRQKILGSTASLVSTIHPAHSSPASASASLAASLSPPGALASSGLDGSGTHGDRMLTLMARMSDQLAGLSSGKRPGAKRGLLETHPTRRGNTGGQLLPCKPVQ